MAADPGAWEVLSKKGGRAALPAPGLKCGFSHTGFGYSHWGAGSQIPRSLIAGKREMGTVGVPVERCSEQVAWTFPSSLSARQGGT